MLLHIFFPLSGLFYESRNLTSWELFFVHHSSLMALVFSVEVTLGGEVSHTAVL